MAVPSGTITLSENDVLTEAVESALEGIGTATVARILQVGSGVTAWEVNDTVGYSTSSALSFKEIDGDTYQVVASSNIRLKYEAAP